MRLPVSIRFFSAALLATSACTWRSPSMPAARPLTRAELSSSRITVGGDRDSPLSRKFSQALADEGFDVVDHPPFHMDLEVTLSVVRGADGPVALAKLRTDDFFVEDACAPLADDATTARTLAHAIAISQAMSEYVHNGGTPQTAGLSSQ